jgi:peroxiredoxin
MKTIVKWVLLLAIALPACISDAGGKGKIRVWGELKGVQRDSVYIYRILGNEMVPLASAAHKEGKFDFQVEVPGTGLYFLGLDPTYGTLVLLGEEEEVEIQGEANMINNAKVISPQNQEVKQFTDQAFMRNNQMQNLNQQLYYAKQMSPDKVASLEAEISAQTNNNLSWLDSVSKGKGFSAKMAPFFMYRPFTGEVTKKYKDEIEHYKEEHLNFLNFNDPSMPYIPYFTANVSQYFEALAGNSVPTEEIVRKYTELLAKIDKSQKANLEIFNIAALTGLSSGNPLPPNPDAFLKVFEIYSKNNPQDSRLASWKQKTDILFAEKKRASAFSEGAVAPDFKLPTPEGGTLALSDLRGKIVLLDFWASWCGPCRMENPNVVKMYAQYKDKGFEVLGVSLDKEKAAWLQAIRQDGLTWKHVSDLKYWQCEAARMYNVTGIPMTFLIGKDGTIIGKNLRGPALEAKLKELFN